MKERVALAEVHREPGGVKAGGGRGANMAPESRARTALALSVRRRRTRRHVTGNQGAKPGTGRSRVA